MFFLYYFFYGSSFAKVPWVYNPEVNSLGWRTRGAAAATATNWMGGFIVTQFTSVGVNHLHRRFYLSKTACTLAAIVLGNGSNSLNSFCNHCLVILSHRFLSVL